jgi:hypothetical protein
MAVISRAEFQQIPRLNQPLNTDRLEQILKIGLKNQFALKNYEVDFQAGYDEQLSVKVYMNCVSNANQMQRAVFDEADGIYHISLEYKDDEQKLIPIVSNPTRVEEIFNKWIQKISPDRIELWRNKFKENAIDAELQENPEFLAVLAERCHKVAVLILDLDIDLKDYEKEAVQSLGGFFFITREEIDPTKIKHVILSQQHSSDKIDQIREANPGVEFHFVPNSHQKEIPYSYKKKQVRCECIRNVSVELEAPDFLPKLTEIYNRSFSSQKPMLIHAARL